MLSEEVFNASLDDGNAEVEAKGLRTPGGLITSMVPGLSAGISPCMGWGEAVGKPRRQGRMRTALKPR